MQMNSHRPSAAIVPFPIGGRAGIARRDARMNMLEMDAKRPVLCTDSWYHQAAIEESDRIGSC